MAEAGRVVDVRLPTDRETGKPRGFAFVEFSNANEAADAITRFHNREIGGRRLNVNAAEDRPRRTEGPRPPFRHAGAPSAPPDFSFSNDSFDSPFGGGPSNRPFKNKGSRRGMRGRKRSLNF